MVRPYEQIVKHIEAQRDLPARAGSFGRFHAALDKLVARRQLRFDRARTIVIAGTNGKGSTAKALQTLLTGQGLKTGLFTSPHLIESTERIRIDGLPITRELFAETYSFVEDIAVEFELGHFEIVTLMAAEIFFGSHQTDWKIFEVGIGGEFDPTRLMPHATSVITPLGFDHEKILGASMLEIAKAKLGIIEPQSLVVHAPWADGAHEKVSETQARLGGRWIESKTCPFLVTQKNDEPAWVADTPWGSVTTDLVGARGIENLSLALCVFKELGFDPSPVLALLSHVNWPGRMEAFTTVLNKNKIYLSGDHNPQGVKSLIQLLESYSGQLHIIVGIADGKDAEPMLKALFEIPRATIYLTQTPFRPRGLESYGTWLKRAAGASIDPMAMIKQAHERAQVGDRIVVTGSLYLIGEVRKQLLSSGASSCQDIAR